MIDYFFRNFWSTLFFISIFLFIIMLIFLGIRYEINADHEEAKLQCNKIKSNVSFYCCYDCIIRFELPGIYTKHNGCICNNSIQNKEFSMFEIQTNDLSKSSKRKIKYWSWKNVWRK